LYANSIAGVFCRVIEKCKDSEVPCGVDSQVSKERTFEELLKELGPVLRGLAKHKESEILEGRMLLDHVHMLIAIPPKYAVSQVVGYIKGKSAIHIVRTYLRRERNFTGQHFWARGYYVSAVGLDKVVLRQYIQKQTDEDCRYDQLNMFG
jgi:putative transposase